MLLQKLLEGFKDGNSKRTRGRRNVRHRNADSDMRLIVPFHSEALEDRALLAAFDFGDAPDTAVGTGVGNYQTTLADNGPRHTIGPNLFLGNDVDEEGDGMQNVSANGDDTDQALPDDEDGVLNFFDLQAAVGTIPTITIQAVNDSGSTAGLYGWIDYNQDGIFNNTTEQADVLVPDNTQGTYTLSFPAIPAGSEGTTYARFRLSTDIAVKEPFGPASNGEVEDYVFTITSETTGNVIGQTKIANNLNGGPPLSFNHLFGQSAASIGDINGDGIDDMAVGAPNDSTGGASRGALYVMTMNADGSAATTTKIASSVNGGPALPNISGFGSSVAAIGDIDGDGVVDLAVGAQAYSSFRGAVYIIRMNANGTAKSSTRIGHGTNGGPVLATSDFFGRSVAGIGDFNADGVPDMIVGASDDSIAGSDRGAAYVMLLNSNGTAQSFVKIAHNLNGGPTLSDGDQFGFSATAIGDLNGDDVTELVVGARGSGGEGAVFVMFMNPNGSASSTVRIGDFSNGGPNTMSGDFFGTSVAAIGDIDGDGVTDIAVGAPGDDTGASSAGAVYLLPLQVNGQASTSVKIASGSGAMPALSSTDLFGSSVASIGDLNGDGIPELSVGATGNSTGGVSQGGVYVLNLGGTDYGDAPDPAAGTGPGNYRTRATDSGPSHAIVHDIFLGASVDGDFGHLQNAAATADNADGALPVDEDGVLSPADLLGTENAQPTITLQATNLTGTAATLYGWIDYNGDGVFSNSTERAQVAVPDGSAADLFTLTFATIPGGSAGKTYARFRLSTDSAGQNSTGAADDGEVEDYAFEITSQTRSELTHFGFFAHNINGGPVLADHDRLGSSIANIGDLNGDGIADVAVGAIGDDSGGVFRGAVYITLMSASGHASSTTKIAHNLNGGPTLTDLGEFGSSIASIGDLDGDGVTDIAVGAMRDDTGASSTGAVYVLFLNVDGTVKSHTKIASSLNGGPALAQNDFFGSSIASLGDVDGDGIVDLAVGATGDDSERGAVYILRLDSDGTVTGFTKLGNNLNGGPVLADDDGFGSAVTSPGDLNGDGVADLAIGASHTGAASEGVVHLLFMNSNSTATSVTTIGSNQNGLPGLFGPTLFGASLAATGDLDGDGIGDISVGAIFRGSKGAIFNLLLNSNGSVHEYEELIPGQGGVPSLNAGEKFGDAIASLGDLDGNGTPDLVVGVPEDDEFGGPNRGTVFALFTKPAPEVNLSVSASTGTEAAGTVITVTATADSPVFGAQTIDLGITGAGVSPSDYTLSSTTITIPGGQTTGSVTFTVLNDNIVESSEVAQLNLFNPSSGLFLGPSTSEFIAIQDDDAAVVSIGDVTMVEGDYNDVIGFEFTVSLSAPVDGPVTLQADSADGTATLSDNDYSPLVANPIVFGRLQTVRSVTVNVNGDLFYEDDETFTVGLSSLNSAFNVSLSGTNGIGSIVNDEVVADELSLLTASGRTPGNIIAVEQGSGLALVPDGNDNAVYVFTDGNGDIVIQGIGGSTVNGMPHDVLFSGAGSVSGTFQVLASTGTMLTAMNDITVAGLNIFGGAQTESLELSEVTINANLTVNLTNGDNSILFANGSGAGSKSTLVTGSGSDIVRFRNATSGTINNLDTGAGSDTVSMRDSTFAGSLALTTGAGNDTVTGNVVSAAGSMRVNTGDNSDNIDLDQWTAANQGIVEPGDGNDTATISNSNLNGLFFVNLGTGNNTFTSTASTFQTSINVNTLPGNHDINFTGGNMSGATFINAFNGTSHVDIDGITTSSIFVVRTAVSGDTVDIINSNFSDTLNISTNGGIDDVTVSGTQVDKQFFLDTFTGADTVALNTTTVLQDLFVNTGNGGDTISLDQVSVTLQTALNAGQATDDVTIIGSNFGTLTNINTGIGNDNVDVTGSDFAGGTSINTDDGSDIVTGSGITSTAAFTIDTGANNDVIDLNLFTPSQPLTIQPGSGNDAVRLMNFPTSNTISIAPTSGNNVIDLQANTFGNHVTVATTNAHLALRHKSNSFTTASFIAGTAANDDVFLENGTSTFNSPPAVFNFDDLTNNLIDELFEDLLGLAFP